MTQTRTVAKIDITVQVDVPDPFPMMLHEEVGKGTEGDKEISVNRNMSGSLLLISITKKGEKDGNGYVVNVAEIVKGLLAHENGKS